MNTPYPFPQPNNSNNEEPEKRNDSLEEQRMIDFASVLDDFMDEEVVDKEGATIGTLSCYWKSVSGLLMFIGIKLNEQDCVRVVPGRRSQVDDHHACIRLGFEAEHIQTAPAFNCDNELDATFERRVYEHFGVSQPQPHDGLKYVARQS